MTTLKIDRHHVKQVFADYTSRYDSTDEKVRLKVKHTYKVAELAAQIAEAEGLSDADVDLAWLLGMLHDVGRFEQLRRFGTFLDAVSIDHAECGADLLFGPEKRERAEPDDRSDRNRQCAAAGIRSYIEGTKEDTLIEKAIRAHNKYRVPETLSKRELSFANILRDADKIDILRVNVETPLEEIYDVTTEDLKNAELSPEVMQALLEHHTVLRDLMKTSIDHLAGHIAFAYELVFPASRRIVREQGFLDQMMEFQSDNERTQEAFLVIGSVMRAYLNDSNSADPPAGLHSRNHFC